MNIRNDSPFAKFTKEQCELLLEFSKSMSLAEMVKQMATAPEPTICSVPALKKFLRRLEQEKYLEDAEESAGTVAALAKRGQSPELREAALATMRERLFHISYETNDRETLMETFAALNAEKAKEEARALEERKVKILEENAKLGWRKLEIENAKSGLQLLPKLRELLMDASRPAEERVAGALACLGIEGGGLLAERCGAAQ